LSITDWVINEEAIGEDKVEDNQRCKSRKRGSLPWPGLQPMGKGKPTSLSSLAFWEHSLVGSVALPVQTVVNVDSLFE